MNVDAKLRRFQRGEDSPHARRDGLVVASGGAAFGQPDALNAASGLGFGMCEYYLDAFGVFGGFVDGLKVEDGYVQMGDWPGFGFERQAGLWAIMKSLVS